MKMTDQTDLKGGNYQLTTVSWVFSALSIIMLSTLFDSLLGNLIGIYTEQKLLRDFK